MRKDNSIKGKIEIASYSDLLSAGVKHREGEVKEMPLINLHTFKDHPFKVTDDDFMKELVESIKEKGVLSPAIVRKREKGGYEIISGHRRKHACELAGLKTMPVIIREMDDNEATILMVDANIQRENILPSEKAFAMLMKLKAKKKQKKNGHGVQKEEEENATENDENNSGHGVQSSISDEIGEEEGISGREVRRYIRLTYLEPGLLERVDQGKITIRQGIELSYIDKTEQKAILSVIKKTDKKMSDRQAKLLRTEAESGLLDPDTIEEILIGKTAVIRTITFTEAELRKYFPEGMSSSQVKEEIKKLLEQRKLKK